jgi:hypothetical protein
MVFMLSIAADSPRSSSDQATPIPVTDLGKKYELIGRLGKPLGEIMTVTATVEKDSEKDIRTHWMTVTSVNGIALKSPTRIHVEKPKLRIIDFTLERQLTLRVYESGGMMGWHPAAGKEADVGIPGGVPPYGFYTWLEVVKAIEPEK